MVVNRQFSVQIIWLALLLGGAMAAAIIFGASWAVDRMDGAALSEESRHITYGLRQQMNRVFLDQDSFARSNDALINLRSGHDDWVADNIASRLSARYGHDRVYVLDPANKLVRAAVGGASSARSLDALDEMALAPLLTQIREKIVRAGNGAQDATSALSGIRMLDIEQMPWGDMAIVSMRPILPANRLLTQKPGEEYLLVSIKSVDRAMLARIAVNYGIDELRIAPPSATPRLAVTNQGRRVLGYLSWEPRRPALALLRETAPATLSLIGLGIVILFFLLGWLRHTSLRLFASQAETSYLAFHDSLTGVANRLLFEDKLREAMAYEYLAKSRVAVISIDLDRFKQINDTLGHAAGDQLIQQVAKRLSFALPEEATLARMGGDEFALVQPGIISDGQARWICQNLLRAFKDPFNLSGTVVHVSATFGVALEEGDKVAPEEMLRRADIALYAAKAAGRDRFEIYDDEMDRARRDGRALEVDLHNALITDSGLFLVYQPIYDVPTNRIAGAEALIRWQHPVRGLLSPDLFISIAEESGLIDKVGLWVLRKAAGFAVEAALPWIAVNVSPAQLRDSGFADQVLDILRDEGLPPHRLELEITEGTLLQNSPLVQQTLATLRAAGIRIAIDDFGTGYSSISYLRTYSVDKLKIDKSFTQLIGTDAAMHSIVRSVIEMAHALRIEVTAEGVEDDIQADLLTILGCNYLQGFLLSQPISGEKLLAKENRRSA